MSIPQLRKSFDHMERFTLSLLRGPTKDVVARRKAFQKEWLKVFKRPVDDKAADAYLLFEARKGKKKTRKQRGGAPLGGAPLDYSMGPGVMQTQGGQYGSFPAYIDSGFDSYATKINQDSITSQCGQVDTTPKMAADLGSNQVSQKGGKRSRRVRKQMGGFPTLAEFGTALTFRPLLANNPTTALYDAQMYSKGLPMPASPSPNTATPLYTNYKPHMINTPASGISRDLTNEIRTS